jgi:hypothetical protein
MPTQAQSEPTHSDRITGIMIHPHAPDVRPGYAKCNIAEFRYLPRTLALLATAYEQPVDHRAGRWFAAAARRPTSLGVAKPSAGVSPEPIWKSWIASREACPKRPSIGS